MKLRIHYLLLHVLTFAFMKPSCEYDYMYM